MQLVLPVFRANFELLETYIHTEDGFIPVPVTVFGGREDQVVAPAALLGWNRHVVCARTRIFRGDHFYLHATTPEVIAEIAQDLESALAEVA